MESMESNTMDGRVTDSVGRNKYPFFLRHWTRTFQKFYRNDHQARRPESLFSVRGSRSLYWREVFPAAVISLVAAVESLRLSEQRAWGAGTRSRGPSPLPGVRPGLRRDAAPPPRPPRRPERGAQWELGPGAPRGGRAPTARGPRGRRTLPAARGDVTRPRRPCAPPDPQRRRLP